MCTCTPPYSVYLLLTSGSSTVGWSHRKDRKRVGLTSKTGWKGEACLWLMSFKHLGNISTDRHSYLSQLFPFDDNWTAKRSRLSVTLIIFTHYSVINVLINPQRRDNVTLKRLKSVAQLWNRCTTINNKMFSETCYVLIQRFILEMWM